MTILPNSILRRNYDTDTNAVRLYGTDSLKFQLSDIEEFLLFDGDGIAERQSIYRDIYVYPELLERFEYVSRQSGELASFFVQSGELGSTEAVVYSLLELRIFCQIVDYAAEELFAAVPEDGLGSLKLRQMRDAFARLAKDEKYTTVRDWLEGLDVNLKHIRSVTLGANLDAQLRISELGIVSFNEQPFVSSGFLEGILRGNKVSPEYKCLASLGIKETGKLLGHGSIAVNREFFEAMNGLFRGAVKNIRRYISDAFKAEVAALLSLGDDLVFVVKSARYMMLLREQGLRLTFPRVSSQTEISGLANPNLIDKCVASQIVTSDVNFDPAHRMYVLTGPNSGGKSVYLSAVGIAQLMFQLGMPICADAAQIKPCTTVAALFVREIVKSTESRLANEVVRLRECLEYIDSDSLLLLDETFSSTSAYDGVLLAESLVKYLVKLGGCSVYATHFHELSERVRGLEGAPIHLLCAESSNGHRTYRIVPYSDSSADTSLARDIVIENGLGFLFE